MFAVCLAASELLSEWWMSKSPRILSVNTVSASVHLAMWFNTQCDLLSSIKVEKNTTVHYSQNPGLSKEVWRLNQKESWSYERNETLRITRKYNSINNKRMIRNGVMWCELLLPPQEAKNIHLSNESLKKHIYRKEIDRYIDR